MENDISIGLARRRHFGWGAAGLDFAEASGFAVIVDRGGADDDYRLGLSARRH